MIARCCLLPPPNLSTSTTSTWTLTKLSE
ncbi:BnaA09g53690D [Brassica napus]|uniref:BnaA09g53690D protein n=1 Tax=Brassica napus TaxID=3708 RepID=A0A078JAC8_BRANA|nr:BnaA09g53690D [Brassica napus]